MKTEYIETNYRLLAPLDAAYEKLKQEAHGFRRFFNAIRQAGSLGRDGQSEMTMACADLPRLINELVQECDNLKRFLNWRSHPTTDALRNNIRWAIALCLEAEFLYVRVRWHHNSGMALPDAQANLEHNERLWVMLNLLRQS
jgi:hypothetical protein